MMCLVLLYFVLFFEFHVSFFLHFSLSGLKLAAFVFRFCIVFIRHSAFCINKNRDNDSEKSSGRHAYHTSLDCHRSEQEKMRCRGCRQPVRKFAAIQYTKCIDSFFFGICPNLLRGLPFC